MKTTLCLLFSIILVNGSFQNTNEEDEELNDTQNFIYHFNSSNVSDFCNQRKYVVMYFEDQNCETNSCLKRSLKFRKISEKFLKHEVLFIRVPVDSAQEVQTILGLTVTSLPHFAMSNFSFIKNFKGRINHLRIWIKEILDNVPIQIQSLNKVKDSDKHYFVYFNKPEITLEHFDIMMLGRLIHPISLYFGVPEDSPDPDFRNLMKFTQDTPLVAYREYDDFILPLDSNEDLHALAQIIRDHEFPSHCQLTLKTMKFITHHQLPTFLYFDTSPEDQPFYEVFKALSEEYNDYLMFCTVDLNLLGQSQDNEMIFYLNFLAGGMNKRSSEGFMRVLHYTDRFRRYRVSGDLNESTAQFLIRNYLHDNLKEYISNQKLGERNFTSYKKGIRRINKNKFDEIQTHRVTTHLVYVYSSLASTFSSDIEVLQTLARAIEPNKHFSISILDHDQNDLDGLAHENLPYVMLCNRTFERKGFQGDLTFASLLSFLAENISWLKIKESFLKELKDEHGIDVISDTKEENI
jgi:hypothetical protein